MDEPVFVVLKVLLRLLFPTAFCLAVGALGLLLWRRRRVAFLLLFGSFAFLAVAAVPVTGLVLVGNLESEAGDYADPKRLSSMGIRHIVVLSGEFREGDLTSADHLGGSILRLMEGIRLWRAVPGCKLVLTGGIIPGLSEEMAIAEAMAAVAQDMGVPKEDVILESRSWTTEDQAKLVASIVGKEPFALVAAAFHMPRSLMLFRFHGLNPIPAPADFLAKSIKLNYDTLIPQARGLGLMEIVVKENLATLALWAKYRLK